MPALRILQGAGNACATLPLLTHEAVDGIEADVWVRAGEVFVHPARPLGPLPFTLARARLRRTEEERVEIAEVLAAVDGRARLLIQLRSTGGDPAPDLARVLYPLPDRSHLIVACEAWAVADRLRAWLPGLRIVYALESERVLRRYVQARMGGTLPATPVIVRAALLHTADEVESLWRRAGAVGVRGVDSPARARDLAAWGAELIVSPSLEVLAALR